MGNRKMKRAATNEFKEQIINNEIRFILSYLHHTVQQIYRHTTDMLLTAYHSDCWLLMDTQELSVPCTVPPPPWQYVLWY